MISVPVFAEALRCRVRQTRQASEGGIPAAIGQSYMARTVRKVRQAVEGQSSSVPAEALGCRWISSRFWWHTPGA